MPGHLKLTSPEVEWLYANLRNACKISERAGYKCDQTDTLHTILDKLDRARYQRAVPVLTGMNAKLEDEIMKAVKKRK